MGFNKHPYRILWEPILAAHWDGVHAFSSGMEFMLSLEKGSLSSTEKGVAHMLMPGAAVRTTKLTAGPRQCHG